MRSHEEARSPRSGPLNLLLVIAPVAGLVLLTQVLGNLGLVNSFRTHVPTEAAAFERVTLKPGQIELVIRNDGSVPFTIAQVLVNDAYWAHQVTVRELGRFETAKVSIPYPWDAGAPVDLVILTSTGATLEHHIEAAATTPEMTGAVVTSYILVGLLIGAVPIGLGLLWFGVLTHARPQTIEVALAFTVGLLLFLLVETVNEGLQMAGRAATLLNGVGVFSLGVLLTVWAINAIQSFLGTRTVPLRTDGSKGRDGLLMAYLVALGIGLHNLGEGLAVGSALATGHVALGTTLIVGFMVHNLTEGLAIASPLAEGSRPQFRHFAWLVVIAGALTIPGVILGGASVSAVWTALFFGVATGAIAQVIWVISRDRLRAKLGPLTLGGLVLGFVVMYVTGLLAI